MRWTQTHLITDINGEQAKSWDGTSEQFSYNAHNEQTIKRLSS